MIPTIFENVDDRVEAHSRPQTCQSCAEEKSSGVEIGRSFVHSSDEHAQIHAHRKTISLFPVLFATDFVCF